MIIQDIKGPKWINSQHTTLECQVLFAGTTDYVPFGAVASGDLPHTHEIFARCVAGEFGPIGEYVEPVIPTPTLAEAITAKLAALAAYRFGRETGGINVNGINVLTDRESQATLTGAYVAVQLNPTRLIDWKASDGTWTQIDKTTVEFLANAVADHVQGCFSVEKSKAAEIQALTTVEAVLAYDVTVGW